jgi:uncharacterized protein YbjT (DUF2867 family)
MGSKESFLERDREAAKNFARAARAAGLERIIYLGGLGKGSDLSPHLESRQEVGRILRQSGIPTLELRASIIIGSGSLSFELVRALVEKLPVMITPSWVRERAQPISIEDVLEYLLQSIFVDLPDSLVVEIGGPDQVSYEELMREYARHRGLKRLIIPVPILTPRLSSLWLGLVTPVFARIGRKLVESLRNPTLVEDRKAESIFSVKPRGFRESIARALRNEDLEFAETRWSDSLSSMGEPERFGGRRVGSRIVDSRTSEVEGSPARAFDVIRRVGGKTGWYYADWLWSIRGHVDLLMGGVGSRRGRRHPVEIAVGDPIDYWRVEAYSPQRLLRLNAEMKLPGRAWLQFEVTGGENHSTIRQTAEFDPVGLGGLMYWYGLYPFHKLIFTGMLRAIARKASSQNSNFTSTASRLKRNNEVIS